MDYNPSIFKAYDIRGLVGKDFDEAFCEALGRAFVVLTGAKTVVAGRDMRGSSPVYFAALTRGIMKQGADVVDIGMVSTPMFYHAVSDYDLHDAGIMVTASHNPSEYNGFKMTRGDGMPIGKGSGMEEVRELVARGGFPDAKEGTLVQTDIVPDYLDRLFELVPPKSISKLKVVVDAGNGMGGVILPKLFERLDVEVYPLYWEPDGTFPNHEANPIKTETLDALRAKVQEVGAHIGVALDGDADRIGLTDERGEVIRADQMIALMAHMLLAGKASRAALYDLRCSDIVPEEIKAAGGVPVMTPAGHAFIKPLIREREAVFGGELSGHFYFETFGTAENTDYVILLFLQMLSQERKPFSELVAHVRRYAHSGEINFKVPDPKAVIARIRARYAPDADEVIEIDGLRLNFDGWWFNLRPSNTEPLLRLNLEARDQAAMEEKKRELTEAIEEG